MAPIADAASEKPTVLIAGAGVAGLSLALFLVQSGKFRVRLFERFPELQPAMGGHYGLNSALACLDRANLRHVWEPLYQEVRTLRFRRHRSAWKLDVDMKSILKGTEFEGRFGSFMRGAFQGALAEALPDGVLECGKEIVDVKEKGDGVRVGFKDGSTAEGDVLLAADGINSAVRRLVFGEVRKVYSGTKIWYMLSDEPPPPELQGTMMELRSADATILSFSAGSESKHAVILIQRAPEPSREDIQRHASLDHLHELLAKHGAYEAGMLTEAKLRGAERLLHFPIYSMPTGASTWSSGRVCLLGDSVHAMTPFMGQGANQAVQSAFCLARLLEERGVDEYEDVFRELHSIREPVTSRIINMSNTVGLIRIPRKDEGCLLGLKRALFFAFPRWAPKLFGRKFVQLLAVQA